MIRGDCREVLPEIGDSSVDMVVTGLPYWGPLAPAYSLLGHERTFEDYLDQMALVFEQLKRVCSGTIWIVGGDDKASGVFGQAWAVARRSGLFVQRWLVWWPEPDIQNVIALGDAQNKLTSVVTESVLRYERDQKDIQTFPQKLVRRLIDLAMNKTTKTVLDPFAGTGTVSRVCDDMGIASVCIEGRPCRT